MLLNLRAQYATTTARQTADSVISALTPAAWYRNATDVVSSGGFASIWADYADSNKGLVLPDIVNNFASTPSSVPLNITGDFTLILRVRLDDWTPALGNFCGKLDGSANAGYRLTIDTGTLSVMYGTGAALVSRTATATTGITDNDFAWIKVVFDADNGATQNETKFYKAADAEAVPTSWTQIGSTVVAAGVATIATHAGTFAVGMDGSLGGGQRIKGSVARVILYSDISETTKVFDADFSAQAIGTGSFTESSSNAATVTINTSGASPAHIGKARDLLQGTGTNQPAYNATGGIFTFDGLDNWMEAVFVLAQPTTVVLVANQISWTNDRYICDGATALAGMILQSGATPSVSIYAGTAVAANTNMTVGAYHIAVAVFSGASSSLLIDATAKTTGNAGTASMGGFVLGARGDGIAKFANIGVKEAIVLPTALSDANQAAVVTALNNALTVF